MRARLGQHFLKCHWVVSAMLKTAKVGPNDTVLEVGPGTGVLTRALAKEAGRVVAIEKDPKLAALLEKSGLPNTKIITADILKFMESDFINFKPGLSDIKVVSNIPYHLTSRLFRLILESRPRPKIIVFTIQKEVAERITARPPKMNLLGLSVQLFGKPEIIKTVPKECFSPRPEVESAIIKISAARGPKLPKNFWEVVRRAYGQKRKMLRRSIGKLIVLPPQYQTKRPGEVSPQEWLKILA